MAVEKYEPYGEGHTLEKTINELKDDLETIEMRLQDADLKPADRENLEKQKAKITSDLMEEGVSKENNG